MSERENRGDVRERTDPTLAAQSAGAPAGTHADGERQQLSRLWDLARPAAVRRRPEDDVPAPPLIVMGDSLAAEGETLEHASSVFGQGELHVVGDVGERPAQHAPPRRRAGRRGPLLGAALVLADGCAALIGSVLPGLLLGSLAVPSVLFVVATMLGWWAVAGALGLYRDIDVRTWASGVSHAPRLLVAALLLSWPLYALSTVARTGDPATEALAVGVTSLVASGLLRAVARAVLHRKTSTRQRTLVIGSGAIAAELVTKLQSQTHFGLDPIGFVDDDPHLPGRTYVPYCGSLDELADVLDRHAVDRVIIAFTRASHQDLLRCLRTCRDRRVATDVVPRLFEMLDGAHGMAHIGGLPLISITVPGLSPTARVFKRTVDVIVTCTLLVALLPLLAAAVVAIKLETRGPVLFRQIRVGRRGCTFDVLKFRSMYEDAEARKRELGELNDLTDGVMFKIHEDPRITRVGRFLRRYSLDEMPQLLNVLRGEMSLVGPRPLILTEAHVLLEDWHLRRLDLRPGITGPWQVQGRSDLTISDMVRFDYAYVSGWSLARDFEILLATLPAVLSGRGAY